MHKKILFLAILFSFFLTPAATFAADTGSQLFAGMYEIEGAARHNGGVWLFSGMVNSFLAADVPLAVIYLLLSVPFITFFIAFLRQVIGISTFGVYTPLMLTLTFMLLGIWFGVATLLVILVASYFLRMFVNRINLLYIPRTSFTLSAISLAFFVVIWFGVQFGSPVAITLAIFPMLMMSTIAERFLSAQSEEGLGEAVRGVIQTVLVAIVCYAIVIWPLLSHTIIRYPEIIFLPMIFILIVGKFTGLRLIEYFRFRSLFRENVEEE